MVQLWLDLIQSLKPRWGILRSDCAASSVWSSSRIERSSSATLWRPSSEISPTARVAMLTCSDARLPTSGKEEALDWDLSALPATSATHRTGFNLRVAVRMQRLRLRRMHQAKHRISVGKASDMSKLLIPTGVLFELTTASHAVT